ncbi:MAG: Crp/Fnr family transcriptional regulator [Tissierellia bacterium]|nr:Crp/Fnr family transcriptional regulator [Tissierellia bacterium]
MNYFFLARTPLFHGTREEELKHMLTCLGAREKTFKKGEVIFRAGSQVHEIGLVEAGSVNIVVNFYWGNSQIFGHIEEGAIFGENYAAIPGQELLSDVVAAEDCQVLFLDMGRILKTCEAGCHFHHRLIFNLLHIAAKKNLKLSSRMTHTAPRSIRARLLSYLSEQAMVHGSTRFAIPFNRQELADYLGVDRSALSNELSKMQKEGLIRFKKNQFSLKNLPSH